MTWYQLRKDRWRLEEAQRDAEERAKREEKEARKRAR